MVRLCRLLPEGKESATTTSEILVKRERMSDARLDGTGSVLVQLRRIPDTPALTVQYLRANNVAIARTATQ